MSGCFYFNIGWNYSYQLIILQQISEEVEAYQDTTWVASDINPPDESEFDVPALDPFGI